MTILGIGTARSGTMSLARLLAAQGLDVGHEKTNSLPWARDRPKRYARAKRELKRRDGDVACWLTQAAEDLMEALPEAKIIALHRPKPDTVESLLAHMAGLRIRSSRPFGPMVFPTYRDRDLKAGWEAYYDDAHAVIDQVCEQYPSRTLRVATYQLETREEQRRIADFLGVTEWTHIPDCHHNRRQAHA